MPEETIPRSRSVQRTTPPRTQPPQPDLHSSTVSRLSSAQSTLAAVKLFLQPLPALEVLMIELRSLQREPRRPARKARLKHERERVLCIHGLQLGLAGLLKRLCIRAVPRHAIVQARAARHKTFGLGVVLAINQPHKLIHEVAMKPRRSKRMLGHHPARRKNHEVKIRSPRNLRRRSQHRVNRRIRM